MQCHGFYVHGFKPTEAVSHWPSYIDSVLQGIEPWSQIHARIESSFSIEHEPYWGILDRKGLAKLPLKTCSLTNDTVATLLSWLPNASHTLCIIFDVIPHIISEVQQSESDALPQIKQEDIESPPSKRSKTTGTSSTLAKGKQPYTQSTREPTPESSDWSDLPSPNTLLDQLWTIQHSQHHNSSPPIHQSTTTTTAPLSLPLPVSHLENSTVSIISALIYPAILHNSPLVSYSDSELSELPTTCSSHPSIS